MICSFGDKGTEDIFYGRSTEAARKTCPQKLWGNARRKMLSMNRVPSLQDLRKIPGHRVHKRWKEKKQDGQYSLSINDQYRILFFWTDIGPDKVEIKDPH